MKIKAHVTDVADHGEKLRVTGQGQAVGKSHYKPRLAITIEVPISKTNRKAYYVGRHFEVKLQPA